MLAKNKQTRETFSIKAIIPTDCMYNRNTMSAKRMEENYINISTPCEGVEAVVRQCMCVNDLKIKTPAQVPEYSYLLPTCHSPDLLTSPCRCSSPRLCHTCSGTPETLHTDTHTRDNTVRWCLHTNRSESWLWTDVFRVPALRWGLLLAHKMALNLDSSVPSLFSPAAYSAWKEPENISVWVPNQKHANSSWVKANLTWASCLARAMSTFSLSSRLPWMHHAEEHQYLYKQVLGAYR